MGMDIHGWVEVRRHPSAVWTAVIVLGALVGRNGSLTAWLFRDAGTFPPIAAERGVPPDASPDVMDELGRLQHLIASGEIHSFTWATWGEIEAIDWDVEPLTEVRPSVAVYPEMTQTFLRTRQDTLLGSRGWALLFDLARRLAKDYGDDHVRFVVWFDS